eukprot:2203515-Prorocentrum_lima.AAC.1
MTSSLVGSEMCIRDSLYLKWQLEELRDFDRRLQERYQRLDARHRQLEDCLLYTSDAADDM